MHSKNRSSAISSSAEKYALPHSGFRISTGQKIFLLKNVKIGSGIHLYPYPLGTGCSSPAVKGQTTCLHLDSKLRMSGALFPPVHKFMFPRRQVVDLRLLRCPLVESVSRRGLVRKQQFFFNLSHGRCNNRLKSSETEYQLTNCDLMVNLRTVQLTLCLPMSYIYGAPCKARNFNVVYIWTYVWQR
jgi:hypothetical protein